MILTLLLLSSFFVRLGSTATLFLCEGFVDQREFGGGGGIIANRLSGNNLTESHFTSTATAEKPPLSVISVSESLMSTGQSANFSLETLPMRCSEEEEVSMSFDSPVVGFFPDKPRTGGKPPKHEKIRGKVGPHFTPEGFLEYNHYYYGPKEFCISSISDEKLQMKVCSINCQKSGHLCIPKCCGVGEVLVYWKLTCAKPDEAWTPYLYDSVTDPKPNRELNKITQLHYHRPYMTCSSILQEWPISSVKRPVHDTDPHPGTLFKLLKDGSVKYLPSSNNSANNSNYSAKDTDSWKPLPRGKYCVDGFINWGKGGTGEYMSIEDHQVILLCPEPTPEDLELQKQNESLGWVDDVYVVLLSVSSAFILATALIHIVLFDRQNIHGLTVMSQCISLLCFYLSHAVVFGYAQRRDPIKDKRSLRCMILAILSHYFLLTTYTWLTVTNFDLWLTFRSMRPISKMSNKMRRFRLYSAIGWGIPLTLMAVFVTLDLYYEGQSFDLTVPGYGIDQCYVSGNARKQYICSVLSIVLPINVLLTCSTFKIFNDFNKGSLGVVMPKRAKGDKYSFKLFLKIFVVMGSVWTVDICLCWFYNTGRQTPWFIHIFDSIQILQAVLIFIIFCCNRRTITNLETKFPGCKGCLGPIRRLMGISELATDVTDATPPTPGGSRKMSMTSVTLDSTLDRRRR